MANKSIVSNSLLNAIAQAIAQADGGSSTMQLSEMPARIEAIASGSASGPMQTTEMSNQTTASDSGKRDKA